MSNFRNAFNAAATRSADDGSRERRITATMQNQGITRAEAPIVDDAIVEGIKAAVAEIGGALDTLTPRLAIVAMPAILDMFALNAEALNQGVMSVVFGVQQATPDCDCPKCKAIRVLETEMDIVAAQAEGHGGGVH